MLTLREQLITSGHWDASDMRDPATDSSASAALLNVMKNQLAEDTQVVCCVSEDKQEFMEVFISRNRKRVRLARSGDLYGAICKAALALPAFLKQHPECAK